MKDVLVAPLQRRTWLATVHVVGDLFAGVLTFTVVFTLLSTAFGLAITVVLAVPVVWLLLVASRGLGRMERSRAASLLGVRVADPHAEVTGGFLHRMWDRLRAASTWKEIAYHVILLPLGSIGFSLVVSAWAGSLVLLALPFVARGAVDDAAHFWFFDVSGAQLWWGPPLGIAAAVAAAWIARGWAAMDGALVRNLLGPSHSAELEARVGTLTATRALAVDAAEEERRRIERDLHDGAQQRLVALAMDLGMAKAKFDDDPDGARALLDEAHDEAKRAIAELRDLARGIHPVALTDRGLPGAIPSLASRAPFPVEVIVDVAVRPAPAIEGIAYFLVSEALTNVAKHSGASSAAVSVVRHADRLLIDVRDDGHGGADLARGTGLRGLADRVKAVDGVFVVRSPIGGPTTVHADLPVTAGASS